MVDKKMLTVTLTVEEVLEEPATFTSCVKVLMDHFSSGQQILSIGVTIVSINYYFF